MRFEANPLFIFDLLSVTRGSNIEIYNPGQGFKTARLISLYKESFKFLLDHPRRCFYVVVSSVPTWWLFFILVVLNGFDLVIFCILDLHDDIFQRLIWGTGVLKFVCFKHSVLEQWDFQWAVIYRSCMQRLR